MPTSMLAIAAVAALGLIPAASAKDWPHKPVRVIVAFGPGGGTDIVGCIVAQGMQEKLGQPVVVENHAQQ